QIQIALNSYFWSGRMVLLARTISAPPSRFPGTMLEPGMLGGGLLLLPVLLLGLIGLLLCLRHPVEQALWLAFAVLGFLPPLLGFPSPRRFLAFDLALGALAPIGLPSPADSS